MGAHKMFHWRTRWRRGIVTKNWHWRAAMFARFGNWLLGRAFRTDTQRATETEAECPAAENKCRREKTPRLITDVRFTIQCACCGKQFKRQSPMATALRPRKSPQGFTCYGTIGFFR